MLDLSENKAQSVVWVSADNETIGILEISDQIKESSSGAIQDLHDACVKVIMVTGDNDNTANAVGRV